MQHLSSCFVSSWEEGYAVGIYAVLLKYYFNQFYDCLVGIIRILTAFEYTCISAFQAECSYVESNIGASLVDDTYDSKRHADARHI